MKSSLEFFSRCVEMRNSKVRLRKALKNIIGQSPRVRKLFRMISKASQSQGAVLITGESGTGKELVARAIATPQKNFVVVNCSAIPENLFESELFGHVKGAFTGAATERIGLFEEAHDGCLFLDEIGDMPLAMQTKLLRALQEGEIRPVGSNLTRQVNVRVIAATNRNLSEDVADGNFREDLFFRLNVIPIHVPPLREREEDIPGLVHHFLSLYATHHPLPELTHESWQILFQHSWPGNVRELENVIHRALALHEGQTIHPEDISLNVNAADKSWEGLDFKQFKEFQDDQERDYITFHIRKQKGSITKAAEAMGINRTALHNRIRRLNLDLDPIRNLSRPEENNVS